MDAVIRELMAGARQIEIERNVSDTVIMRVIAGYDALYIEKTKNRI